MASPSDVGGEDFAVVSVRSYSTSKGKFNRKSESLSR